jgi:hypothetical protein
VAGREFKGLRSQPWILAGERSSLLTRIGMPESVSLCVRMKTKTDIYQHSGSSVRVPIDGDVRSSSTELSLY